MARQRTRKPASPSVLVTPQRSCSDSTPEMMLRLVGAGRAAEAEAAPPAAAHRTRSPAMAATLLRAAIPQMACRPRDVPRHDADLRVLIASHQPIRCGPMNHPWDRSPEP